MKNNFINKENEMRFRFDFIYLAILILTGGLVACTGSSKVVELTEEDLDALKQFGLTIPDFWLRRCIAIELRDGEFQSIDDVTEIECNHRFLLDNYSGTLQPYNRNDEGEAYKVIQDTTGLEVFSSLEILKLPEQLIHSIDLTAFPELRELNLDANLLSELDLSKNLKLEKASLAYNPLTALKVKGLSQLKSLTLTGGDKELTDIFGRNFPEMRGIKAADYTRAVMIEGFDELISLVDLKMDKRESTVRQYPVLPNLHSLDISASGSSQIDLSGLPALRSLDASDNPIVSILFSSKLDKLGVMKLVNCSLSEVDPEWLRISEVLHLQNNDIKQIALTDVQSVLRVLRLRNNRLAEIELRSQTALTHLTLENNDLASIDISGAPNLHQLKIDNNLNIDLLKLVPSNREAHTSLTRLSARDNHFAKVDLGMLTALRVLTLDSSKNLKHLDVSSNVKLHSVYASDSPLLERVTFAPGGELDLLSASDSNLLHLDLSSQRNLEVLKVPNNQLGRIELKNHANLRIVDLSNNGITEVDFGSVFYELTQNCKKLINCYVHDLKLCGNADLSGQTIAKLRGEAITLFVPAQFVGGDEGNCARIKFGEIDTLDWNMTAQM